jgi:hypothetical protein
MKKVPSADLGENHRRGISTTLIFLDEALCEFEQWANGREARSVLYREVNAVSPAQRDELRAAIRDLRATLRRLKRELHLEGMVVSGVQSIWAKCSSLREHLVELEGKHLRRYGAVTPALASYLDGAVQELLERMDRIAAAVVGDASDGRASPSLP